MTAVDRTAGEAVERQHAADAPPPPPPPDTPGAEGFPSRAESKAYAASAAGKSERRDDADDPSDTPDATGEEQDTSRTDGREPDEAPDRDEPETREDGATDRSDDSDRGSQDEGQEQPSSPEEHTEAGTVDDDHTSADTTVQTDAADHREPDGVETGTGERPAPLDAPAETSDDQRPDDFGPPSDHPGADPGVPSSAAEGSTDADAGGIDQRPDVEQDAEPPGGRQDVPDQQSGNEPSADAIDDHSPADTPDSLGQATEIDETISDTGTDLVGGSDEPGTDVPADGADPAEDPGTEAPDTTEEERIPDFDFTTDDGTHVLAYLDRGDESDELEKPGSPADPPSGQELLELENAETRKLDKFRRSLVEASGDILDEIKQDADTIDKIVTQPPPTGHAETQAVPDHPQIVPTGAPSIGDLAMGLFVGSMVLGEGIVWIHGQVEKLRRR